MMRQMQEFHTNSPTVCATGVWQTLPAKLINRHSAFMNAVPCATTRLLAQSKLAFYTVHLQYLCLETVSVKFWAQVFLSCILLLTFN